MGSVLAISSQVTSESFSPTIALGIGGLGFGCLADYQNTMQNRRACFFAMGVCSMGFALASGSWPLFVSNLSADVMANSYFIYKYDLSPNYKGPLMQKLRVYLSDIFSGWPVSQPVRAENQEERKRTVSKTQELDI